MKQSLLKISLISFLFFFVCSCNVIKRIEKKDHLITENTIYVDDKKDKSEALTNLISQKTNSKLLGISPVKLHFYNLARPNIDSLLNAKIYSNPKKVKRKTNLFSKKQFDKNMQGRKNFNAWLKRTGEAPAIVDEEKTIKTTAKLRGHFVKRGWLDADVSYKINREDNQRATIDYYVERGEPYILDSITENIASPIIDSLYQNIKAEALIKTGGQFKQSNYTNERERINTSMRNSGVYHFGLDYVSFVIDTIGTNKKVNTELLIKDRLVRYDDSVVTKPFKIYKIKEVNIFTDYNFEKKDNTILDSVSYDNYNLYSFDELKYRPKAITDAIFISKGNIFRDIDRTRTNRYLSELRTFNYPNIDYVENEADSTLTANIYLTPKKKYDLNFEANISQSNIQTIGFSFSTGLVFRNIFQGAETLEVSLLTSIGSSKDGSESDDAFFDIKELGANIRLTIPRVLFPLNTEKVIPKFMSPTTRINLSATSQTNIGLDKQSFLGLLSYNWYPSDKVTNTLDLFNIQFVKNLNIDNYFDVYNNSYNRLDDIARDIDYIDADENLSIPTGADTFIDDVLNEDTVLIPSDDEYIDVNNINQRKERLTENNLIISTSFNYVKDNRETTFDNDFSRLRLRGELAGNLLSGISNLTGAKKNSDDKYEVFGVPFSQYVKAEVDYVKYWNLGRKNVLAFRSFLGLAIPYGNSDNIPFSRSFSAGGPNDNRAWTPFDLGPGSSDSNDEFNEANLKLHFSVEHRFNIFGDINGALFVDVGNIWNALDNVETEGATFNGFSSLRDIAVGSGFGLRYDLSVFVVRMDIGFKTYDPSFNLGNRWFKEFNFGNAVYNIGINYPF